jgi:hypothetical protein
MAESSCPYCAERDTQPPMAHAPRWNAMVAVYRELHGHYPGCPTQVRRVPRDARVRRVLAARSARYGVTWPPHESAGDEMILTAAGRDDR